MDEIRGAIPHVSRPKILSLPIPPPPLPSVYIAGPSFCISRHIMQENAISLACVCKDVNII